jgi:hypothetical protein
MGPLPILPYHDGLNCSEGSQESYESSMSDWSSQLFLNRQLTKSSSNMTAWKNKKRKTFWNCQNTCFYSLKFLKTFNIYTGPYYYCILPCSISSCSLFH